MIDWRVPISTQQPSGRWTSHLIEVSKKTNVLVKTACGKLNVNPGFARKGLNTTVHCKLCERKEHE